MFSSGDIYDGNCLSILSVVCWTFGRYHWNKTEIKKWSQRGWRGPREQFCFKKKSWWLSRNKNKPLGRFRSANGLHSMQLK